MLRSGERDRDFSNKDNFNSIETCVTCATVLEFSYASYQNEVLGTTLEKAQRWATTHASVFAPDKFQLTHFTRSRKRMP